MSTATLEAPATARTPVPLPSKEDWSWLYDAVDRLVPGQSLLVTGANWDVYQRVMQRRDGNRPGMRIQYDRGEIQIMPTYMWHELCKSILGALIECYCEENEIDFINAGGMTVSQEDRDRGFEPDECFYVKNVSNVLGKRTLDFAQDPPPDLTLEVEITSPVSKRMMIFAAFRVPEVWRFDGKTLRVFQLDPSGSYREAERSLSFPHLAVPELGQYLLRADSVSQMRLVREFRDGIRDQRVG